MLRIREVFTAGGIPDVTYNDRSNLELESKLLEALALGSRVISITGPTKIGKTVLWKKAIPVDKRVFVPGGIIREEEDIWNHILTKLEHHLSWTEEQTSEEESKQADALSGGVQGSLFGVAKLKTDLKNTTTKGKKQISKISKSFSVSPIDTAIELLKNNNLTLVVDDFHYIDRNIQSNFIRAIKDPITTGLDVIICAVPHRDHDALKAEPEMTGRVFQLPIKPWEQHELREIAEKGFNALNLTCSSNIIDTFIKESYKSPHLMQEFCAQLCVKNRIFEEQTSPTTLQPPTSYQTFFEGIVNSSNSKEIYETLLEGPSNSDRKMRQFQNGSEGDIYLAIMHALAELLGLDTITPDLIRGKLREILEPTSVPTLHQVKGTLKKMAELAKDSVPGEPPVDYQDNLLHVVDPFFSFYLKWCDK